MSNTIIGFQKGKSSQISHIFANLDQSVIMVNHLPVLFLNKVVL